MSDLKGKIAVITGGTSGIGLATVREFIDRGATVVFTGRRKSEVDRVASELKATGIVADQGSVADIEGLVSTVRAKYNTVDILFINAGIVLFSSIEEATEEHFDKVMDVNFKGSFFTLSRFIPLMRSGGAITILSSINATTGQSNCSTYSASKAALLALVRVGATELSPRGIRINAICPGPIGTNLLANAGLDSATMQNFATSTLNKIPLHRFGKPEDVAKLVAFLSSENATFITGSEYVIDGGTAINAIAG